MSKPATQFGSFFRTINLDNGDKRVVFTDDIPEWLKDACGEAMHHCISDWAYVECEAVCDAFDAGDFGTTEEERYDAISSFADLRVDVYTQEVFKWAMLHCLTDIYSEAQERASELGDPEKPGTIEEQIKRIQYCAIESIAQTILAAIAEHTADADLDADEN